MIDWRTREEFDTLAHGFGEWLAVVDAELEDRDSSRDALPYQLYQWWELWDHVVPPVSAVSAALLLQPAETVPLKLDAHRRTGQANLVGAGFIGIV